VVNFDVVMLWMQYIRNNPENAYRFSENFWDSQIESKKWLLDHVTPMDKSIVIFGGWYGVLAQFIAHKFPDARILTTDLDSECKKVFAAIDECYHDITFRQHDMRNGMPLNNTHPDLVINTSSEHVTQEVYDAWWDSIPIGTKYIVQGNNLVNPEHVRLADNLEEFLKINKIKEPEYAGMLKCGHFYRYMAVGYKK
jgi:trans-aconitate methyltransferase